MAASGAILLHTHIHQYCHMHNRCGRGSRYSIECNCIRGVRCNRQWPLQPQHHTVYHFNCSQSIKSHLHNCLTFFWGHHSSHKLGVFRRKYTISAYTYTWVCAHTLTCICYQLSFSVNIKHLVDSAQQAQRWLQGGHMPCHSLTLNSIFSLYLVPSLITIGLPLNLVKSPVGGTQVQILLTDKWVSRSYTLGKKSSYHTVYKMYLYLHQYCAFAIRQRRYHLLGHQHRERSYSSPVHPITADKATPFPTLMSADMPISDTHIHALEALASLDGCPYYTAILHTHMCTSAHIPHTCNITLIALIYVVQCCTCIIIFLYY